MDLRIWLTERKYRWWIRPREGFIRWIAWHLPRELVMWCFYRVGANATQGQWGNTNASELLFMDAAKRWKPAPTNKETSK